MDELVLDLNVGLPGIGRDAPAEVKVWHPIHFAMFPLDEDHRAQRAGAGLIISEGTIVSPQARGYPFTPGIWSAEQVAGWRTVTAAVHEKGGLIVCQLWHCGRLSLPEFHDGQPPVAPSAVNPQWKMFSTTGQPDTVTPHALTRAEIRAIVADFRQGAANAMAAGFDGVEIHSSNGYLFHQFFSAQSNQRDDEYGGSHENRARFFFEVLDAVGEVMPFDRTGFRLNPMLNRFHGLNVDADTVPMWESIVRRANDYGLAFLHLTEPFLPRQLDDTPHALADVGVHFRPLARMPIIAIVLKPMRSGLVMATTLRIPCSTRRL